MFFGRVWCQPRANLAVDSGGKCRFSPLLYSQARPPAEGRPEYHHGCYVTGRDLTIYDVVDGKNIQRPTAHDVMIGEMSWRHKDADVKEVAHYRQEKRVRYIPAVNHDKRMVGMISIRKITKASTELAGEMLRKFSAVGD